MCANPIPAAVHTCADARREVLKVYLVAKLDPKPRLQTQFYLQPTADRIFFHGNIRRPMFAKYLEYLITFYGLKRLAFKHEDFNTPQRWLLSPRETYNLCYPAELPHKITHRWILHDFGIEEIGLFYVDGVVPKSVDHMKVVDFDGLGLDTRRTKKMFEVAEVIKRLWKGRLEKLEVDQRAYLQCHLRNGCDLGPEMHLPNSLI